MLYNCLVTARVRSTTGRYCFHRCLSVHRGGYPYPIMLCNISQNAMGQRGGYLTGYPPQVPDRVPPRGGTQSGGYLTGYPPGGVPDWVPPQGGYPVGGYLTGYPPGGVPDWVPPQGGYLVGGGT